MNPERVIFLDVDGVLNHAHSTARWPTPESRLLGFDPKNVAALNEILEKSEASIVVSSTWRLRRSRLELQDLLRSVGVNPCQVIGKTPAFYRTPEGKRLYRGDEIQAWMNENFEPKYYVILDDDADMVHLMNRLVQTDFREGLLPKHVSEILRRLGCLEEP